MSKTEKLMSFEEFRVSEVAGQQREHFRDEAKADAILQPGSLAMPGWVQWPDEIAPATR